MAKKEVKKTEYELKQEKLQASAQDQLVEDTTDDRSEQDKQTLNLEQTEADREVERKTAERLRAEPTSTNGMYGNTKPVSSVSVEAPVHLNNSQVKNGSLKLMRNLDA